MIHHFHLGESVQRAGQTGAWVQGRIYEVVAVLPGEQGVPRYRIKSPDAGLYEAGERNLVAASPRTQGS